MLSSIEHAGRMSRSSSTRTDQPTLPFVSVFSISPSHTTCTDALCKGIFVDGVITDVMKWTYPKPEYTAGVGIYQVGDNSGLAPMSWSIASSYLFATPLGMPAIIHYTPSH